MLDIMQTVETYLNIVEGLAILGVSVWTFPKERRVGFRWIWFTLAVVGTIWAILYMVDATYTLRTLMGMGIIKSTITLTLSVILGIALQLRIPREK